MKYLLIENNESGDGATVTICATPQERRIATLAAVFGASFIDSTQEDEANKILNKLSEDGALDFEGDSGLLWVDACEVKCHRKWESL